jgi:hypothetical protein
MAKKFRRRDSSRDPLAVQISVRLKLPPGMKPTAARVQEAIDYRINHDEDHPLAKTKIIRWRNPARKGSDSAWRQGNQDDAWTTLKKWIAHSHVDVFTVRPRERNRRPKKPVTRSGRK